MNNFVPTPTWKHDNWTAKQYYQQSLRHTHEHFRPAFLHLHLFLATTLSAMSNYICNAKYFLQFKYYIEKEHCVISLTKFVFSHNMNTFVSIQPNKFNFSTLTLFIIVSPWLSAHKRFRAWVIIAHDNLSCGLVFWLNTS